MTAAQTYRPASQWLLILLGCMMLLAGAAPLQAQILPTGDDSDTLVVDGDSTLRDSSREEKVVKVKTMRVAPDLLMQGREYYRRLDFRLDRIMYRDELERLPGFAFNMGQPGKPYQRFHYGLDAAFLMEGPTINRITGMEEVYTRNQESQMPFFDTRTPYVNIYYGQGKADLAMLTVDVSQNISPWVNASILYERRNSAGVYSNFATDHSYLGAAVNLRSRNDRYHAFVSYLYQGLSDEINGGVAQKFAFEDLFGKGSQEVSLQGAQLFRVNRGLYLRHFFRLTGDSTRTPLSIRLYHGAHSRIQENEFTDGGINAQVYTFAHPVYPTLTGDSSNAYERMVLNGWQTDGGAILSYQKPGFAFRTQGGVTYGRDKFHKNYGQVDYTHFKTEVNGSLEIKPGPFAVEGDWRLFRLENNLFNGESFIDLNGRLKLPGEVQDYYERIPGTHIPGQSDDTVVVRKSHRPFGVTAQFLSYTRNPTWQMAYGDGWAGNAFTANPGLDNRRAELLRLGVELQGKAKWTKFGETPGNRIGLTAFRSRQYRMIYFDSTMTLQQAPQGLYHQWLGVEASFRLRFLKTFFLEGVGVAQRYASAAGRLDGQFQNSQPPLYGKASWYFENKNLSFAAIFRAGLEYHYFHDFNTPLFDPATQQFYPQTSFTQPGYHRLDAFIATQVKRVYLYLRVVNTLEGLQAPGYFTTTYYPMMDRNVMLGLNWTFFD